MIEYVPNKNNANLILIMCTIIRDAVALLFHVDVYQLQYSHYVDIDIYQS